MKWTFGPPEILRSLRFSCCSPSDRPQIAPSDSHPLLHFGQTLPWQARAGRRPAAAGLRAPGAGREAGVNLQYYVQASLAEATRDSRQPPVRRLAVVGPLHLLRRGAVFDVARRPRRRAFGARPPCRCLSANLLYYVQASMAEGARDSRQPLSPAARCRRLLHLFEPIESPSRPC